MPAELEEALLGALVTVGLDATSGTHCEVLVLHRSQVPAPGGSVKLHLERLMVRDLFLVGCHVNTCNFPTL